MHRVNLLNYNSAAWLAMVKGAGAARRSRERRHEWQLRLIRWRIRYARMAFILGVWGGMVAGVTLALALPGARWVGVSVLIAANGCIWADTTRRLFADGGNGFFEPPQR